MDIAKFPHEVLGEVVARLDLHSRFASFALCSRLCLDLAFSSPLPLSLNLAQVHLQFQIDLYIRYYIIISFDWALW